MSIQVQRRRGTAAENAAFTGAAGEFTYSTDTKRLNFHDGSTAGGILVPKGLDLVNQYFTAATASGTDTITLTLPVSPGAYAAYQSFTFKPAADNTGAATLNVNSLGAKNIYKHTGSGTLTALSAGDLQQDIPVVVIYDGTQFIAQIAATSGGWTQIGSPITPSGSATANFTSIPQTYTDLLVSFSGLSNATTTRSIIVQVDNVANSGYGAMNCNGIMNTDGTLATHTSSNLLAPATIANTASYDGFVFIGNYRNLQTGQYSIARSRASSGGYQFVHTSIYESSGAIDDILFSWNGSGNFDAGTLTLYGRM